MPIYRCFIRGENFPGVLLGQRARVGFFTTRFVDAADEAAAEAAALALAAASRSSR